MNGATLLGVTLVYFLLAYCIYGRRLKAIFGIESKRECPSKRLRDDIDYVPTPMMVLFGHHFASIAGAGPIVGPIVAAYLGWGPACLWILLGCVFIGSMHDFAAMFLSVRNDGRSIAYAIEQPADVDISLEPQAVVIEGKAAEGAEQPSFKRRFELNYPVDTEKSTAAFKNGILRIELPKAAQAVPKKIEIAHAG